MEQLEYQENKEKYNDLVDKKKEEQLERYSAKW